MSVKFWIGETLWAAVFGIAATVLCFGLFVLLQIVTYHVPAEPIDRHLRQGFESGDLVLPYSLPDDSERGYHQRNDCLIYWMSRVRPDTLFAHLAAGYYVGDPSGRATYCETLRDALIGDAVADYEMGEYTRYLHGYRVLTAFALSVLDIPSMRIAFKALCYGLLICTFGLAVRRLMKPSVDPDGLERLRAWAGVTLCLGFGLFYGLPYFGQSPSHAPAAWVIFLLLLVGTQCDLLALRRGPFYATVALFGAFTAFFDYLTGAAPVCLALLIGLMAFQGRRSTRGVLLFGRAALASIVFVGAIVLSFIMNLALNVAYFGTDTLVRFFAQLSARMSTEAHSGSALDADDDLQQIGVVDVLLALDRKLAFLGYGNHELIHVVFVFALNAIWAGALIGFLNSMSFQHAVRVVLAVAPALVVALWYLAFQNHTIIHAAFMVRNLVWIPCAAGLACVIAAHLWRERALGPGRAPDPAARIANEVA